MTSENLLKTVPTEQLSPARVLAHRAAQHLTKAARANLEAQPDDSHSSLIWDMKNNAFLTQYLGRWQVGLSLSPFQIFISEQGNILHCLSLDGTDDLAVAKWLDNQLGAIGLKEGSAIALPYQLPDDVAAVNSYDHDNQKLGLQALAAWYGKASEVLNRAVDATTGLHPGPSPVRCWPHHFDIATYISLEEGDPETARGIGVGLSPGDDGYAQPYFYTNPWPHLDRNQLPPPVEPGHWHIDGYVGLIATATALQETPDTELAIELFVRLSIATARSAQGL